MGKFRPGKAMKKQIQYQKDKNAQVDKVKSEKQRTEENIKAQKEQEEIYRKKQQQKQEQEKIVSEEEEEQEQENNQEQVQEEEQEQEDDLEKLVKEELQKDQVDFLQKEDIVDKRKVIVVLEGCMLQVAKVNKCDVLLNSDEHKGYISQKLNRDFSVYRPDVVHHALLSLMDSPLNKAGLMQVYIHTEQNVLIEINPNTKIPRTYKRFSSLMIQLLNKLRIRAVQNSETLLKVIKNPITDHLPMNCLTVGTSCKGRLVNMNEYVKKLPKNGPICFAIGGVSKGNPGGETDYCDDIISVSKYSLSAGYCITRMLAAFENLWEIL